jgi:hypothetical protein
MVNLGIIAVIALALVATPVYAQQQRPPHLPFTATLSNNTPLAFGMTVEETAAALNAPLTYIRGTPGNEVFAAPRPASAGWFAPFRNDQLFLQFRNGRLAGWKGDWGKNWMWE